MSLFVVSVMVVLLDLSLHRVSEIPNKLLLCFDFIVYLCTLI